MLELNPPPLLRSPHLQTILSSRVVRRFDNTGLDLLAAAERVTLDCADGVRLAALVNIVDPEAPLVIMLHGWLGRADSPYIRRAAQALSDSGLNVARLLLRDHGGTAALNRGLFNAARIGEVVDACNSLALRYGRAGAGLMGFSLGGNFALRAAVHERRHPLIQNCLAVCPVANPATSAAAIDRGLPLYRWYFLRKWRRAFQEKQAAFPDLYDFGELSKLSRVSELTDYLVRYHTEFADTEEYYEHYTLSAERLAGLSIRTRILATADDPVIPVAGLLPLRELGPQLLSISPYGGHCAYLTDFRLQSAVDRYATHYFGSMTAAAD